MPRMPKIKQATTGWTNWIKPVMAGYRLGCCDCGLVHDVTFRVIRWGRGHKVVFKARRNNRSTAAVRRKRQAVNRL